MKAFILAAGYGTRLEPLTLAVPKPMVLVGNFPILQYNLELLAKYGIKEAFINLHYHPDQIKNYFGDGSAFGIKLSYSFEEALLGTAGGVRKMAKELAGINDTFLVFSSDVLTDINLNEMLAFHKKKKALATIALTEVSDVSQFGVVVRDKEERISGFQEKPRPELALSRLANTGIYIFEPEILEMVPEGFYDFGKELFPKLVHEKAAFYGYAMSGYWNDIGSLERYREANSDVSRGRVKSCVQRALCLFLILFMLAGASLAEETQGARPMGMGGAFVGVADDINSIFINPAGVGFLEKTSMLATARVSSDKKFSLFAGVQPTPLGNLGLSYLSAVDPSVGNGVSQTFSFTYAQEMNRVMRVPENMGNLSIGANVKIAKYPSGSGFDFDLASIFRPDDKLSLGFSFRNSSNVDTLLLGAAYRFLDGRLLCSVENSALGIECQIAKKMLVRAGRMGTSYTYGFGLEVRGIAIDYACILSASSPVYYFSAGVI